ncbi:MAG: hypothetical protein ACRD22_21905, partial [Terriglobia bacterium]
RSLSLDRGELRISIERISRFAEEHTRCIVVDVSPGQLVLQAEDSNVGRSEEVLPVAYTGEPARIGFNAFYLADFLSRSEYGQVRFLFKDGSSAAELQPETESGDLHCRYVVMPMKVPLSTVIPQAKHLTQKEIYVHRTRTIIGGAHARTHYFKNRSPRYPRERYPKIAKRK